MKIRAFAAGLAVVFAASAVFVAPASAWRLSGVNGPDPNQPRDRRAQAQENCYDQSHRLMPGRDILGPVRKQHIRDLRKARSCVN